MLSKMDKKQEVSQEQIDAWKKQHGDIYAIKVDGKTAYLKKPDRKTLSFASVAGQKDPMKFNEIILENCFIGGDEEIKKDMMTYVCGHLCHWALDATSHPYVFYRTGTCKGKSAWYHHRFESLIDAIMLKVKKECTIEDFKFYEISDASKEEARAIARIYVPAIRQILGFEIKPHQIMESLKDWHFIESLFYDASGDKLKALQTLETFTKAYNSLSGYIVPNEPDDPYDVMNLLHTRWVHPSDDTLVSTESFFDLYDKAQLLAMEAIRLFLAACENPDLDDDLLNLIKDRNYNLGTNDHKEMINFDLIYEK